MHTKCSQCHARLFYHLDVHLLKIGRHLERRLRLGLDLLDSDALGHLLQGQALDTVDIEDSQVGDDGGDALLAGEREGALVEDLGVALLVDVLHGDDDLGLLGVGDEVHGAADALDLAGKHEVGEI